MNGVSLLLEPAAMAGLVLSMIRVGAFAVSSPILRAFPTTGRVAFSLAVGLALAEPALAAPSLSELVAAVAVNVTIGLVLGFLTGLVFYLFQVAGALVDITSGLNAGQVFEPITGTSNTVLSRGFMATAIVLWLVLGGDRLAVEGLAATVAAIPLDGSISLAPGLADVAVRISATMLRAAVELAMPALAALFLTEVGLGIATRFAPQANVFSLGLPGKLLAAMLSVGLVFAAFPSAVDGALDSTRDTIVTVIRGLGA